MGLTKDTVPHIRTSKTDPRPGVRGNGKSGNQGKGAWARRREVPDDVFAENWARTFGPKRKRKGD